MRARDGGVENDSKGWGVEIESEGWGSREWRMRVSDGSGE